MRKDMLRQKLCAAQLMFDLVSMKYRNGFSIELAWGDPNFFLQILSSYVLVRLHTKNHLHSLPGSALKVCVGGGG
jgi:hypothetical protein